VKSKHSQFSLPKWPNYPSIKHLQRRYSSLDKGKLGGGNVESIDVRGKAGIGLLGSVGADEGVDLDGVDVIKLLESELDLGLVGLDIDNEDEGVVLLNLLHGRLGVERVDNDLVLIKTGRMRNRLAGVLGSTRQLEGLGPVEGSRGANLPVLVGVDTLKSGLGSGLSLLGTLGGLGGTACIIKDASAIALVTELAKSAAAS
jgi:hypothetical protein